MMPLHRKRSPTPTLQPVMTDSPPYRFPQNLAQKDEWIEAVRRAWVPEPNTVICSDHFKPEDFYEIGSAPGKVLRPNVVPSIFGCSSHQPIQAEKGCGMDIDDPTSFKDSEDEETLHVDWDSNEPPGCDPTDEIVNDDCSLASKESFERNRLRNGLNGRTSEKSLGSEFSQDTGSAEETAKIRPRLYLRTDVFPLISSNAVKKLIVKDQLLAEYAENLCAWYYNESSVQNVCQILVTIGETVIELMLNNPSITKAEDIFHSCYYRKFVLAIKKLIGPCKCSSGESCLLFAARSLTGKIKIFSDYVWSKYVTARDKCVRRQSVQKYNDRISEVELWQDMYELDFKETKVLLGIECEDDKKCSLDLSEKPRTEDVNALIECIENKTAFVFDSLTAENCNFDKTNYITLVKCLLLKSMILNRTRVDVDNLLITEWQQGREIDSSSEEFNSLTELEQNCASSFSRLSVVGRFQKKVAFLVSKKDVPRFEKMVVLRREAGVTSSNVFLFADNDTHFKGSEILWEFAQLCDPHKWRSMSGARLLSKDFCQELAVSLRYANLNEADRLSISLLNSKVDKNDSVKHEMDEYRSSPRKTRSTRKSVELENSNCALENYTATDVGCGYDLLRHQCEYDPDFLFHRPRVRKFAKRTAKGPRMRWSAALKDAIREEFAEEAQNRSCATTQKILDKLKILTPRFPELDGHEIVKIKSLIVNVIRK